MKNKGPSRSVKISRRDFFHCLNKGIKVGAGIVISTPLFLPGIIETRCDASNIECRNKKDSMGYRRLGKTNLMVSTISFGCALNYGCDPLGIELNGKIRNLFDVALDIGINLFDISPNAKGGYIQEKCFQHFKAIRDDVFFATKVDNFKPTATRQSINRSLRRMKTDYIDIVYLHNMGRRGGWRRGLPALEEIRKMIDEGKVRFAGVSDHDYKNLLKINLYKDIVDVVQFRYNIHRIDQAEKVISTAKIFDIGTIAMKVLGGAYKCWSTKDTDWKDTNSLKPFISKRNKTASAAVKFVLKNSNLSSALIGMRSENEIIENAQAALQISQSS